MQSNYENPYRWVVMGLCFLMEFMAIGFIWFSLPVLVPTIADEFGMKISQVLVTFSAIPFAIIFTSMPSGIIGDIYPTKWIIATGGLLAASVGFLRGLYPTYVGLLIASLICGLSVSLIFNNIVKVLTQWFSPQQMGLAQGLNLVGFNLGAGVAQTISASWVPSWVGGWENTFILYGLLTLLVLALWVIFIREPESVSGSAGDESSAGGLIQSEQSTGELLQELFSIPVTYLLSGAQLMVLFGFNGYVGVLPTWAEHQPFHVPHAVIGGPLYAAIAGALILPPLADRVGRKLVLNLSVVACSAGIVITGFATSLLVFIGGVVICGIALGALGPLILAILGVHPDIGSGRAATMSGIIFTLGQIGGTIAPYLGGRVYELSGVAVSSLVVGAPLLLVIPLIYPIPMEDQPTTES